MAFLTRQFIPPVARHAVESRWAHASRPAPRHARGHIGQPRGHRAFLGISLATLMAEPSDLDPTGPRPRGPRQPSVHGPTAQDRVTSGGVDRRCEVHFGNTVPCPFLYGTNRSKSERDCRMDPWGGTGRPAEGPLAPGTLTLPTAGFGAPAVFR